MRPSTSPVMWLIRDSDESLTPTPLFPFKVRNVGTGPEITVLWWQGRQSSPLLENPSMVLINHKPQSFESCLLSHVRHCSSYPKKEERTLFTFRTATRLSPPSPEDSLRIVAAEALLRFSLSLIRRMRRILMRKARLLRRLRQTGTDRKYRYRFSSLIQHLPRNRTLTINWPTLPSTETKLEVGESK
jgi:hypothetical protein